jgi:hypothetical protein
MLHGTKWDDYYSPMDMLWANRQTSSHLWDVQEATALAQDPQKASYGDIIAHAEDARDILHKGLLHEDSHWARRVAWRGRCLFPPGLLTETSPTRTSPQAPCHASCHVSGSMLELSSRIVCANWPGAGKGRARSPAAPGRLHGPQSHSNAKPCDEVLCHSLRRASKHAENGLPRPHRTGRPGHA